MGISNVNNVNKIDLTKLKFGSRTVTTDNRPEYLKMTGSIFNAPGVKGATTSTLGTLNTNRSLSELRSTPAKAKSTGTGSSNDGSNNGGTEIKSASEGKAAAANANSQASKVKSQTTEMKSSEKTVNKYSADAQKQEKKAETQDKKFQKTLKAQEKEVKEYNLKLQKTIKENLEAQTEITNAQNELDSLLGQSSFSANNNNGTSTSNNNSARIQELQTFIGTKSKLVQNNGKTIYSLQRSSNRTLKKMKKTNATYVKTNKRNMKNIASTQTKAAKVAQTAQKFESIAAMVSQVGQLVNYAGQGLVLLGQSISSTGWGAGVGAALIATGQVMQKVGNVVEMVGNYGQTAANITKGAAMAADGNLAGAMQAFGSAAATGAAAVKQTKDLKGTFGQIDAQAKEATKKAAANRVAKEKVKGMSKEELGGLSKKQMRKSISSQLQADKTFDAAGTGKWSKKQFESYKNAMSKTNANGQTFASAAANNAKSTYATNTMAKLKEAGLDGKYKVTSDGKITDKVSGKEVTLSEIKKTSRKDARGIKRAMNSGASSTVSGFQNVAKEATKTKSSQKFDFAKLSQTLMATGAMILATNSNNTQRRGYAPQWDLANDSRFQKIYRSNRAHRATVA